MGLYGSLLLLAGGGHLGVRWQELEGETAVLCRVLGAMGAEKGNTISSNRGHVMRSWPQRKAIHPCACVWIVVLEISFLSESPLEVVT